MALNDAVPSSATDVFKRNAEDADRLLNATGNITTRTGKELPSWDEITKSHAAWNNRGAWTTATAYTANDIWQDGTSWYVVLSNYTSGATAADDITGTNVTVLQSKKQVIAINSVSDISGLKGTYDDQQISLKGWHPDSDVGGGILYWDAAKPKSAHNGGTVFSPTVPFSTNTGDYLDGVGETDISGSGCWVLSTGRNTIKKAKSNSGLASISGDYDGDIAITGSLAGGNFGGNIWVWDSDSTATHNGYTVIEVAGEAGRWLISKRNYQMSVDNSGQEAGEAGALTVYQRSGANVIGIDQFNFSGVDQAGGTHTALNGSSSQVIHHYNDRSAVTWDYVGRSEGKGNTIQLLRMAYNPSASGHSEVGSGYFQRFERTVKFDPNYVYPDNRTLAGFKQEDLYDMGLSVTENEWAFVCHGRDSSLTDTIGRGYIQQPIHFWTYGNGASNGAAGLKIFSDTKGGNGLEIQTKADSSGSAIDINHSTPSKAAIVVDNYTSGGNASFVSVSRGVTNKDHFVVQQTVDQTSGFAIKITNSSGQTVGGLSADGKNIFVTDKGTGLLVAISVTNGVISVS